MASALGQPTKGGITKATGTSRPQNTAVSKSEYCSRPGAAEIKIDTSAPSDPHTLGRAPGGWLR